MAANDFGEIDLSGTGSKLAALYAVGRAAQNIKRGAPSQDDLINQSKKSRQEDEGIELAAGGNQAESTGGGGVVTMDTEKTVWRLGVNTFTLSFRTRQWIDLLQWQTGSSAEHFAPIYNTWEFYTTTGKGRRGGTGYPVILNAARLFHSIEDNPGLPNMIAGWKPVFTTHRIVPVMTKWRLSKPVPYTVKPGAAQPEQISGNDTPYFCVGIDTSGMVPTWVNIGGYNNLDATIDTKSLNIEDSSFPDMPEMLETVVAVGKNECFEHTMKWNNMPNYTYQPPRAWITQEQNLAGHDMGSYQAHPFELTYLPQPLRANASNTNWTGGPQYQVTFDHYRNFETTNPPYFYNHESRMPFMCAFVPDFGGNTFQVNMKVLLETEMVVEVGLAQNVASTSLAMNDAQDPKNNPGGYGGFEAAHTHSLKTYTSTNVDGSTNNPVSSAWPSGTIKVHHFSQNYRI